MLPRGLQRLQISEHSLFVLLRQLSAVGMPFVAVPFLCGVEKEVRLRQLAGWPGWPRWRLFEPNFDRIENIVAAMKSLRPFIWRIQHVAQRRHGAIMKIRCAQPDSIQRR